MQRKDKLIIDKELLQYLYTICNNDRVNWKTQGNKMKEVL